MEDFFRDSVWQFVGVILALIAILITIAQRTRKRLAYEVISTTSVVSTTDELDGKIQILFEGKPVKKVHVLVIELSNIGNVPITTNDYDREISIVFNENTQILSEEILETNPENLKAEIYTVNSSIVLKPILLNSGDTITIKLLASDFDSDIKFDGRIIGVRTIEKRIQNSGISLGVVFIVILIYLVSNIVSTLTENVLLDYFANFVDILFLGFMAILMTLEIRRLLSKRKSNT